MLRSHAGAARFAWNWGLARCRERYEAEGKWYSGNDLHKLWNAAKKVDPAHSGRLVVASRWFPSSKLCPGCGAVKAKLALSERTYRCESCDLSEDRDVNAARNLLQLAASGAERLNDCGGAVRPGSAGRAPLKQ